MLGVTRKIEKWKAEVRPCFQLPPKSTVFTVQLCYFKGLGIWSLKPMRKFECVPKPNRTAFWLTNDLKFCIPQFCYIEELLTTFLWILCIILLLEPKVLIQRPHNVADEPSRSMGSAILCWLVSISARGTPPLKIKPDNVLGLDNAKGKGKAAEITDKMNMLKLKNSKGRVLPCPSVIML